MESKGSNVAIVDWRPKPSADSSRSAEALYGSFRSDFFVGYFVLIIGASAKQRQKAQGRQPHSETIKH